RSRGSRPFPTEHPTEPPATATRPCSRVCRRSGGASLNEHGLDLLAQTAQGACEASTRLIADPLGERGELAAKPSGGIDRLTDLGLDRRPGGQLLAEAFHGQPLELRSPPKLEHRLL